MRCPARAAHRQNMPARPQAGEKDMHQHGQRHRHEETCRHAENIGKGDEIPDRRGDFLRADLARISQQQSIDHGAHDNQHHQRRQEGAQSEIADQNAVDQADAPAHGQHGKRRQPQWPAHDAAKRQHQQIGQSENRADAEIDAPGHDDDGQAKANQQIFAHRAREIAEIVQRQKVWNQAAENRHGTKQHDEGDGAVDPGFGQQFAHKMIGNQPVSPARIQIACHCHLR